MGHKLSEETKTKMRMVKLGVKRPQFTKEWKKNMSISTKNAYEKGTKVAFWTDKKRTEETKQKMSKVKKGKLPKNWQDVILKNRGEKHYNWKGGITPLRVRVWHSPEYKLWRKSVFQRDDFTCQLCEKSGKNLQANHIKKFSDFPELRFEISNGITLCKECHKFITWREPAYEWLFNGMINYQPLLIMR